MIAKPKKKVVLLLSLLVLVSTGMGFFIGLGLASAINKKKEDPAHWKAAALKHLQKLQPTEAQQKQFEASTDKAVNELAAIRKEAIKEVWEVIQPTMAVIDKDLTEKQREVFESLKPKPPPEAQ